MNSLARKVAEVARQESREEFHSYAVEMGGMGGDPEDAAFVAWCIHKSCLANGEESLWPTTAHCTDLFNFARVRRLLREQPQTGYVFLAFGSMERSYRACHCGLVLEAEKDRFHAVEITQFPPSSELTTHGHYRSPLPLPHSARPKETSHHTTGRFKFIDWMACHREPSTGSITLSERYGEGFTVPSMQRRGIDFIELNATAQAVGMEVRWNHDLQLAVVGELEVPGQIMTVEDRIYLPLFEVCDALKLRPVKANS